MGETLVVEKKALQRAAYRNDILKLLAMITMLIDHIGYMYFPGEMMWRTIGRLAFPIFAYQIAIGYSKTSNLKKYVQRLTIFAFITQIPYWVFNPELQFHLFHFNVLFMFLASILVLYFYDKAVEEIKGFKSTGYFPQLLFGISMFIYTFLLIILPEVIGFYVRGFSFEYGFLGIAMVLVFHIFREKNAAAIIGVILLYLLHGYYWGALYTSNFTAAGFWSNFFNFKFVWNLITFNNGLLLLKGYYINARGVFALVPIYLLKKIDTSKIRLNKYAGYIFYPAHITVLVIIGFILKRL